MFYFVLATIHIACHIHVMARTARIVVPGVPHHITQRGNRRMQTFFCESDYARYVDLLAAGCREANVEVLSFCLMPNHVHLVLVPKAADGLTRALALAHQRYTWVVNRQHGWQGHLWQLRFYSCPLDDAHLLAAVRYVELNPLRARMVSTPEQSPWSSARGRMSGHGDRLVRAARPAPLDGIGDWREFLAGEIEDDRSEQLRKHQCSGRPLGDAAFVARVETLARRCLRPRPRGRPQLTPAALPPVAEVAVPN